ncbi:putative Polycomb group protein ASXL2 isoform X1 [Podarcis raffonei]|uniref:putative Polycomb group protein ASXL2 isoform X1 n=1 Tax=Podarcis raffonei TaxID=65483 RepID=UPI002329720D|nr:putative Polycomb group protein ASXL2 isoform X1 [Podarcis raffonei]
MREKGRKKKGRTWAEAARTVLEKNPNTPMSHKEILQVIQKEGLKEISGTSPLACLNAMLHTNSRGDEGIFYKVPGRMGVYTLKKDVPDGLKELSEGSEESSDVQSDSPSSENSSSSSSSDRSSNKGGRKSRWRRKASARLLQVASPQPGCPSPSIPPGKVISSSQKLSKKALKQALKQKQRKQQQCRGASVQPVSSNHHLLQQHAKAASPSVPAKPAWEGKQSDGHSSSSQNSTSSSSPSVKTEPSLPVLGKKPFQRSERLHARQLKRTKCAEIDVETPDSILVNTNLRALINKHTFSVLPADCQQRLLLLLPEVDRQVGLDGLLKLSSSALNNEFFTSAAQGWKERLSEGEFTPEIQLRLRQELEKEKKVELWKEHFFESYYGQSSGLSLEESAQLTSTAPPAAQDQPQAEKPATQSPQFMPVSVATPCKEEAAPVATPKAQDALVVPPLPGAASKEATEEEEKPPRASTPPEELVKSSSSSSNTPISQAPRRPSRGAEEEALAGREEEAGEAKRPHLPCPESLPGKGSASQPKIPSSTTAAAASAASSTSLEGESWATPAKDALPASTEQMDTGAQALKRKPGPPEEAALSTPEKRAHVEEKCPPRPPFQSPPQPFPIAPVPKVPPLRIPVSRIQGSPSPFPAASQVSPRPGFPVTITSPRRTGARTLADIKARARMARAQRAAAAAAAAASGAAPPASFVGAIPGPGPGGGRGEEQSSVAPGRPHGAALDLAGPGGGGGPRRAPGPGAPSACPPAPPPAAPQPAPSVGPARAQLQPAPPGVGPGAETSPAPQAEIGSASHLHLAASAGRGVPSGSSARPPAGMGGPGNASPTIILISGATCGSEGPSPASKSGAEAATAPGGKSLSSAQAPAGLFRAPPSPAAQAGPLPPLAATSPAVAHSLKAPPGPLSGSAAATPFLKASSSIPANNPLVAQLLQGKSVPMEQILPKPLTRAGEVKTLPLPVKEGREPAAAPPQREASKRQPPPPAASQLSGKPDSSQGRQLLPPPPHGPAPCSPFPGRDLWGVSAAPFPSQEAQEHHLLQPLMQVAPRQGPLPTSSPPPQLPPLPADFPVESSSSPSQSFVLGFAGRRTSKPAMSGHYLLNISTYGRCPENLRRSLAVPPESRLCPEGPKMEFKEQEVVAVSGGEDGRETDDTEDEEAFVAAKEEPLPHKGAGGEGEPVSPSRRSTKKGELAEGSPAEAATRTLSAGPDFARSALARDFLRAAQEQVAQAVRGERKPCSLELPPSAAQAEALPPRPPLLLSPSQQPPRLFGGLVGAPLLSSGYSGTINVSASPDLRQEALLTGLSDPGRMGDVVSFSVTVTTIPAGQQGPAGRGHPLPGQAFSEDGRLDLPSKCYCRLKAMIVCKGCGAFCHDDCIGPSKLCVSCLVVR